MSSTVPGVPLNSRKVNRKQDQHKALHTQLMQTRDRTLKAATDPRHILFSRTVGMTANCSSGTRRAGRQWNDISNMQGNYMSA